MNNSHATRCRCGRHGLTAILLWAFAAGVFAADPAPGSVDTPLPDSAAGSRARLQLEQRFIREFSEFAGSAENAQNLYVGLRNGSRITLTQRTAGGNGESGTAVLQFNPAALPMGAGSAFISAALARQQLAHHGVAHPAPRQIQAALNGGAVRPADPRAKPVELNGVLTQRNEGHGWGRIAKASGISLGKILGDLRNPSSDAVALGGGGDYTRASMPAIKRGSRLAGTAGVTGMMRTSAGAPAQTDGLIAQ